MSTNITFPPLGEVRYKLSKRGKNFIHFYLSQFQKYR